jgi:hypothetical protein
VNAIRALVELGADIEAKDYVGFACLSLHIAT